MFNCRVADGIATVTMAHPPVNAMSVAAADLSAAAAEIAQRYAALPAHAVAAAKSCIASACDPATNGFEKEIEQTGTLLQSAPTRVLVRGFLDRSVRQGV